MKYPRLNQGKTVKGYVPTKKEIGEVKTVPDEAITIKDLIEQGAEGFPTPMQRQLIELPEDVNQILQGTDFDIPSDIAFMKMNKTQRATLVNNIEGLRQGLNEKLTKEIEDKRALDQQQAVDKAVEAALEAQKQEAPKSE